MAKRFRLFLVYSIIFLLCAIYGCANSSSDDGAVASGTTEDTLDNPELDSSPLDVTISQGTLRGKTADYNTLAWLGIPFAKPPVGNLRWRAPQEPESWDGIRDATRFCSFCTQYGNFLSETGANSLSDIIGDGKVTGSEDCLFLNIWRPNTKQAKLPVYVFIYGGGNIIGRSDVSIYDGARVSSDGNFVFVTVNYRIGYLGWFRHKALVTGLPGDEENDSGNYGTLDIIQSLKWIKQNIAAFGGDPDNVTISGQSAGGINTLTMMVSQRAVDDKGKPLFQKAIVHSGFSNSCTTDSAEKKAQMMLERLIVQDGLAKKTGVVDFLKDKSNEWIGNYLRSKTIEEIYPADNCGPFTLPMDSITVMDAMMGVYEDGYVVPKSPQIDCIKEGNYHKVPVIIGCTKEELRLLISQMVFNPKRLWAATQAYDPDNPDFDLNTLIDPISYPILALYGPATAIGQLYMEGFGVDQTVTALKKWQDNVWVYKFMWDEEPEPFDFLIGAGHAMDLPFVFGNFITDKSSLAFFAWNKKNLPGAEALSAYMRKYYANFVHSGDPNGGELANWTTWSTEKDTPKRMLFNLKDADGLGNETPDIRMSAEMIEPEQIPNPPKIWESIMKMLLAAAGVMK
jgi:para-nitrobenzyl esterase